MLVQEHGNSPSLGVKNKLLVQVFLSKYFYDKKTYILILISFLPLLTIGYLDHVTPDDYMDLIGPNNIFTIILMPLISLILAISAIGDEKENKTISHLLALPVSREEIVLSKWITIMITGLTITIIDASIIFFGMDLLISSSELSSHLSVLIGSWLYLGLWYSVYASIFLFLGIFLDKNALGWGLAIAYFEVFFAQFLFGIAIGNSPYSIASHIYHVAANFFLIDYMEFNIINVTPTDSLLICMSLIIGFVFLAVVTMRRKDFP